MGGASASYHGVRIVGLFGPGGRLSAMTAFLALAAQQGGTLLTGVIAFVLLGPQEYGRTASALAFLNIFVALGSVSSSVIAYRLALMHARDDAMLYRIVQFTRRAVQCSAMIVVGVVVAALWLLPAPDYLKTAIPIEIVAALGFLIVSVLISYQQGYVLARGDTLALLVINALILAVTIPGAWLAIGHWGYAGYFIALALPLMVRGSLLWRREPRQPPPADRTRLVWREVLFSFMLPATAAGFTTLPAYWLSTEILFRIPDGAAALGLITLGISVKQAPMLLATSLISSSGRSVFRSFAEKRQDMVALHRRLFVRAIAPLFAGAGIVAAGGGAVLLTTATAGDVHDVAIVATGLSIVLAMEMLYAFVYMPINMGGVMWQSLFCIAIPKDASFVLASYAAIAAFGWPGFLLALIAWNGLGVILTILVCRRNADLAPFYSFKRTATRENCA